MSELQRPPRPMYESRAVRLTMRLLGLHEDIRDAIHKEHISTRDAADSEDLSFDAFHTTLPTFPMRLCTEVFSDEGPATAQHVQVLLTHPSKSVLAMRYALVAKEMAEQDRESRLNPTRIGMHFPFGGLRGGMVLHNGNFGRIDAPVTIIRAGRLGRLRLQSLVSAMKAIRRAGWTASSPTPATTRRVTPFRPAQIDRDIRHALGHGSTAMILNLFAHTSESRAAGEHVRRVEEREGVVWLRADQDDLSHAVGRNVRTVKEGIKDLRARGLIKAHRQGGGNWYAVDAAWRDRIAGQKEASV